MTCDLCNDTGYVMQDIGTATVPDYVEIPCRCSPALTDADALRCDAEGNCFPDNSPSYDGPGIPFVRSIDGGYYEIDGYDDAPNWLDDPDFIIEGESVLYVPKGWPAYDDFGQPGETPDCPFDPTPPDQPNYLYGTE